MYRGIGKKKKDGFGAKPGNGRLRFFSLPRCAAVLCVTAALGLIAVRAVRKAESGQFWNAEHEPLSSKLLEKESCFLCGDAAQSMITFYRKAGGLGVLSLNDWYMTDFMLSSGDETSPDENGKALLNGKAESGSGTSQDGETMSNSRTLRDVKTVLSGSELSNAAIRHIRTDSFRIEMDSMNCEQGSCMQISWEDGTELDTTLMENNLCQDCLDKVMKVLTSDRRIYRKKDIIPFCLIDFRTLELYSLQNRQETVEVNNYRIHLRYKAQGVEMNASCSA